jgi:hypothetical protein
MRPVTAGLALVLMSAPIFAQDDEVQLIEGYVWKDQTVAFNGKPNQTLKFRYQDCDGTNATKVTFSFAKDNRLIMQYADHSFPVAQF